MKYLSSCCNADIYVTKRGIITYCHECLKRAAAGYWLVYTLWPQGKTPVGARYGFWRDHGNKDQTPHHQINLLQDTVTMVIDTTVKLRESTRSEEDLTLARYLHPEGHEHSDVCHN